MQVHLSLPTTPVLSQSALTVGTFDGVHRGHQLLVSRLKAEASARGLAAAALTFVDMPFCFFRPKDCPMLLTLAEEKIEAFRRTELDHLFIVPFNENIARQSPEEFMAYWRQTIGLKLFVGGPDFALGRDRQGDIRTLRTLGESNGFEVLALDGKLLENGAPISSTRSRGVIEAGQVELAGTFLGRLYTLSGKVVPGQQLGRTIGVPTINLEVHPRKCLPAHGVYAVRAYLDGESDPRPAALNLGLRPTVDGKRLAIEFHVLGEDIQDTPKVAEVEFVAKLREERKFDGLDALVAQIRTDLKIATEFLNGT
jgi:riboflavin kinase/FMN adenylyltransferase